MQECTADPTGCPLTSNLTQSLLPLDPVKQERGKIYLSLKMCIYIEMTELSCNGYIWKHPLETTVKSMEGYWVLILFLKIGVFFFLWRFLPPPFLTAKYSFLNTAIFCSGNSTGEFSVGFLSLLCLECFFSFSCPFSLYPVWQTLRGLPAPYLRGVFQL